MTLTAQARKISGIAGPILVGTSTDLVTSIVIVALVGNLGGVPALAAAGIAVAIYQVVGQTAGSVSIGFLIIGSMDAGSEDALAQERLGSHLKAALFLCIGTLALGSALLVLGAPMLVGLFDLDSVVYEQAVFSVRLYAVAFAFVMLSTALNYYLLAQRMAVTGMFASIVGNSGAIVVACGLIPQYGAAGAVLATCVGEFVSLIMILWKVLRVSEHSPARSRMNWRDAATQQLKLSAPEMINNCLDYVGNLVWLAMIALLGTAAIAANHSAFALYTLLFSVFLAVGVGTQVIVGQAYGRKSAESAQQSLYAGVVLGAGVGLLMGATVSLLAAPIASLLIPRSPSASDMVQPVLVLLFVGAPVMGASCVALSTVKGAGRTTQAAVINLVCLWGIQIGGSYLLFQSGVASLPAFYLAFIAYMFSRAVWALWFLRSKVLTPRRVGQPAASVAS